MKAILKWSAGLMLAAGLFGLSSCSSGYYASERPVSSYYARPATPYYGSIWIEGDYIRRGGRYVQLPGYYTRPRAGYTYQPGYWQKSHRGQAWVKGRWQRR